MKVWTTFCPVVFMVAAAVCGQEPVPAPGAPPAGGASEFKDLKSKVSYIIGQRIGQSMKQDGIELDVELVMRGFREAAAGKPSVIGDQEAAAAMQQFAQEQQAKAQEAMKGVADKNAQEGAAFLADNAKKPDVKTLPGSTVQFKVLRAGTGTVKPKATDTVSAHYSGRLIDGTKFDSSYDRGEPLNIPVNRVIAGWTEALQQMVVGDKWEVYIPGDKAYGPGGSPPVIGPNALLIFEMELLGIQGQ